ncbi:histidine phosphatase family protein [Marinobacterium lacunae]|uniref:histidine phosphatase family protein n=1 Tax=Marinobacterium lacunae TaxID=1232683 RepID=UPI00068C1358|nr:histidine phosphatase family protein [Marinobacterium lacunae]
MTPESDQYSVGIDFLVIRHAATEWNAQKRFQGRRDIPLSEAGRGSLVNISIPPDFAPSPWFVSPLKRAQETARLLGIHEYSTEPALIEMDWGEWEGEQLAVLRKRLGDSMREMESRGLDLLPPNGESPRQVRERVIQWLGSQAFVARHYGIVAHKGVIRAMLSAALDWDMRDDCPVRVNWKQALLFRWNCGVLTLEDYNIPLDAT